MSGPWRSRVAALRGALAALGACDSLLISRMVNVRYLTGFSGSAGLFILTPETEHLVVDFRYTEQAAKETEFAVTKREGPLENSLDKYLMGGKNCAIESSHITLEMKKKLDEAAEKHGVALHPVAELVEKIRIVKDEDEIRRVANATALLEKLMEETIRSIRPGRSELEVAVEYEGRARMATGRPLPFEPIIASGPRSALPHGVASRKEIAPGEFVVVDIGLELDGYVADMTRTIAVGRADARMHEVHNAVHLANRSAAKAIRPGITGEDAHKIAFAMLEQAGLGPNFGHGLGHGLGMEVHEEPRLAPNIKTVLEPGMVFTIEPGAYIEGWGGVRIEDAGVLRENGVEVFNRMERGLRIV